MIDARNGEQRRPPSPLAGTAARISGLADYLDSRIGIPDEAGWHRLTGLTNPELLAAWHVEVSKNVGNHRVAAAYMSNWLIAFLVGGSVMPVLAERRLPLAGHADIAVHRNSGGWFDALAADDDSIAVLPGDPDAGHPSAIGVASEEEMFDLLAGQMLGLEPIITALENALPIGFPALWGAVSDALSSQAMMLADLMDEDRECFWQAARLVIERVEARQPRMRTTPRPFPIEHDGQVKFFEVRGTCCLYYQTVENAERDGDGYCTTCPLRPDDARRRILVEWLDQQQETVAS